MKSIIFFLEEPSAKALLEGLLPNLNVDLDLCRFIVFEGKSDLESQIVRKIQGYRVPNARFVVLRDKDRADCRDVKAQLIDKCAKAGKAAASLVRIACHELESWYLGDLTAVETGLGARNLAKKQNQNLYRNPDNIASPAHHLQRLVPGYQKIAGSRAIGPCLNPNANRSHSFNVFVSGIQKLINS